MSLGHAVDTTTTFDPITLTTSVKAIVRADLNVAIAITKVMASDMLAMLAAGGGITEDDLRRIGWTTEQIKLYAAKAVTRARRRAGDDGGER